MVSTCPSRYFTRSLSYLQVMWYFCVHFNALTWLYFVLSDLSTSSPPDSTSLPSRFSVQNRSQCNIDVVYARTTTRRSLGSAATLSRSAPASSKRWPVVIERLSRMKAKASWVVHPIGTPGGKRSSPYYIPRKRHWSHGPHIYDADIFRCHQNSCRPMCFGVWQLEICAVGRRRNLVHLSLRVWQIT